MIITKETKERFVNMLYAGDVIVIECKKSASRKTYDYKFIGSNSNGLWDFTPLCAEYSDCQYNSAAQSCSRLSIRSKDGVVVLADVIEKLSGEGFYFSDKKGHELYDIIRHLVTTIYI